MSNGTLKVSGINKGEDRNGPSHSKSPPPTSPALLFPHCNSNAGGCWGVKIFIWNSNKTFWKNRSFSGTVSLPTSICHLKRWKFLFTLYISSSTCMILLAALCPGYHRNVARCFPSISYIRRKEKIWLSRYFPCMNYSAPRRMLWFGVIMGGPWNGAPSCNPSSIFQTLAEPLSCKKGESLGGENLQPWEMNLRWM